MRFRLSGLAVLVLFIAVIIGRTLSYGPSGESAPRLEAPDAPAMSGEEIGRHLGEAIRFQTVTSKAGAPEAGEEQPWLDFHDWLAATYPAAHEAMTLEKVAGLTLLYQWEGSDPSLNPIILMAHQDVVPVNPGTEGDWDAPPFAGEIIDGILVGRGALDDKASLITLMEAAEGLTQSGFAPKRTVYFLFGHDEEVAGIGAKSAFALLEERGVTADMVLDEGMVTVANAPLTGGPLTIIGVAEKGYLTVELRVSGEGGHSSTPPRDNAVVRLSRALVALEENQFPSHLNEQPLKDFFRGMAPDMSFVIRMALANRWLLGSQVEKELAKLPTADALVRTTIAPTMLEGSTKENVLPQRASATVNFRIHPSDSVEKVLDHIRKVTRDIDGVEIIALDGFASEPSPVSSAKTQAFAALSAAASSSISPDAPIVPGLVLGATDARFSYGVSENVYRYMPALLHTDEIGGIHGTNEKVSLENLARMARAYTQIILLMDEAQ
ncbi:M20 family peptidase [Parvularcula marina]|uniref:M20/M25/M40 family metallo-hydrolase n=1 Tax=Parvularcula marina TaxID=2292771 RepID=A0A371RHP7_9PROT|nr:M20 family peptidase [Parvularcula marina]RFB04976.1 M20/M25/M40 family metallo-hydrolase [Parvularcula marina]